MARFGSADDDLLLPTSEEREALRASFEALVQARGWTWVVTSPLLEGSADHFPDRWSGGAPSLRRLLRRLAAYAGLDGVEIEAKVHPLDPATGMPERSAPTDRDGGLWFDPAGDAGGTGRRRLLFRAEGPALASPELVVPAAARAVAHAWLDRHDLAPRDPDSLAREVDVAAVYLGFGVLTTAHAHRHIAASAGGFRADRKQFRLGVLGPRNLAYLLGLYAELRGFGSRARRQIARRLPPNPGAFFTAAADQIATLDPPLAERLKIPPRELWPPPRDLAVLTAPFPEDQGAAEALEAEQAAEVAEAAAHVDRGVLGINRDKPVFRVEQRWGAKLGRFLGMAVFIGGGFVLRGLPGTSITMTHVGIVAVTLALLGYLVGLLFRDARCSEPKCGARLEPGHETCPRCGGTIMGTIKHPRERLAAEEALASPEPAAAALAGSPRAQSASSTSTPRQKAR